MIRKSVQRFSEKIMLNQVLGVVPGREQRERTRNDGRAHAAGFGNPAITQAARSVFTSRHATVI